MPEHSRLNLMKKLFELLKILRNKVISHSESFICSSCGKSHSGIPMDLGFNAPFYWNPEREENNPNSRLTSDTCIINNQDFFVRGILEIPVIDGPRTFRYGVWVSLSEKNFKRYMEIFGTQKELEEPEYFGWFSNMLKGYESKTLELKTNVRLQGGNNRPFIILEHTDHPLSKEQHHGITMHRVREIIEINNVTK